MKTVKSALLGAKQLTGANGEILMVHLKEIIKEHRAIIIARLVHDLPTYVDYKFDVKVDKDMLMKIKDELILIENSTVDLNAYSSVTEKLLSQTAVHLTNEPFFKEIDDSISSVVFPKQLKIVQ